MSAAWPERLQTTKIQGHKGLNSGSLCTILRAFVVYTAIFRGRLKMKRLSWGTWASANGSLFISPGTWRLTGEKRDVKVDRHNKFPDWIHTLKTILQRDVRMSLGLDDSFGRR